MEPDFRDPIPGSQAPNNYLYCGQQWDPDIGLYYNRAAI